MNINQLVRKFSQGLKWNAFFYLINKGFRTILTFLLFYKLTTRDFCMWANINSAIFLVLLWLDFGFRKSIPRYGPEFANNKTAMKWFIKIIITFQTSILFITLPIFFVFAKHITNKIHYVDKFELLYLCCILFITEGITAILRLIYHSYFWQKQFNSQMSIMISIQTALSLIPITMNIESTYIIKYIFIISICTNLAIVTNSLLMLKKLYKDKTYPGKKKIDTKKMTREFIKHSAAMWVNNNLKSLTERNFIILFLTAFLGHSIANLFKIANDVGLLFQRVILKTIGTTDTSLFTHIEGLKNKKNLIMIAFKKLISRILWLCIPILGILLFVFINFSDFFNNQLLFQIFLFITLCYLIEIIFSPYERILEVKQKYFLLAISYTPYLIFILFIFVLNTMITSIGLLMFILIVHVVRLVNLFFMVYFARNLYKVRFPLTPTIKMFSIVLVASGTLSILIRALK